jgi:hypothetical protein
MFEKSQSIKEIAKALGQFQEDVESVKKDGINPYFKSKYATLENVLNTIKKPLADQGLSFSQFPTGENELTTILIHTSGEFLQATCQMNVKDPTPQAQGSAITYMRRYAISSILGIATEDDDDGNVASAPKKVEKVDYKAKLQATKSLEELKKVWSSIPAQDKIELESLKNEMKKKYENTDISE